MFFLFVRGLLQPGLIRFSAADPEQQSGTRALFW